MIKNRVMPSGIGSMVDRRNPEREAEGARIASSESVPCTVTVMGFDKGDVLFRSENANVIQVRNRDGIISAMLIRLKGDIWGFSKKGDDDWNEVLSIYGNEDKA